MSGLYVVSAIIAVTMNELTRPANVRVSSGSTASFALGMVEIFKVSTIKLFLVLVIEVAAKQDKRVPDMELPLASVKYGFLMGDIIVWYGILIWKEH